MRTSSKEASPTYYKTLFIEQTYKENSSVASSLRKKKLVQHKINFVLITTSLAHARWDDAMVKYWKKGSKLQNYILLLASHTCPNGPNYFEFALLRFGEFCWKTLCIGMRIFSIYDVTHFKCPNLAKKLAHYKICALRNISKKHALEKARQQVFWPLFKRGHQFKSSNSSLKVHCKSEHLFLLEHCMSGNDNICNAV